MTVAQKLIVAAGFANALFVAAVVILNGGF